MEHNNMFYYVKNISVIFSKPLKMRQILNHIKKLKAKIALTKESFVNYNVDQNLQEYENRLKYSEEVYYEFLFHFKDK